MLIIGSGPTGLGAATRLNQLGHPNWLLVDKVRRRRRRCTRRQLSWLRCSSLQTSNMHLKAGRLLVCCQGCSFCLDFSARRPMLRFWTGFGAILGLATACASTFPSLSSAAPSALLSGLVFPASLHLNAREAVLETGF